VQSFGYTSGLEDGFDGMVEFPPHSIGVGEVTQQVPGVSSAFTGKIYSYLDVVRYCVNLGAGVGLPVYRGVMTGWDNTPRRGAASHIFHESTPDHYEVWLRLIVEYTRRHHAGDRRLVFINAWNEWAEGAYLEPDEHYQYRFLEATARTIFGVPEPSVLIRALRQINESNPEAQRLLDQLDQAVEINGRIVDVTNTRALANPFISRDGTRSRFQAVSLSTVKVPSKLVADGVVGYLDALNTPNYQHGVTLNRAYDLFLVGWLATSRVKTDPNSPVVFLLTNLESGEKYVAQVRSRQRRDDVVKHLKATSTRLRQIPEACSLHSGYRAYLNIASVEPGSYRLDAIVPAPDGAQGGLMRLHSSVLVL
jgi:hypothetical protein